METPGQPDRGQVPTLYGSAASSINRRAVITGGLLLPFAAQAGLAPDLLERAMNRMGGRALLARVKALIWESHAVIGDGEFAITARTRCEPFGVARSESWITAKGPATARIMTIRPGGTSTVEQGGIVTPMSTREALHERDQFAIYGYMLLAQAETVIEDDRLVAHRGDILPVSFEVARDGSLLAADYAVAHYQGDAILVERFTFEGRISDQGINWPRTIRIAQDGKMQFDMTIDTFAVELA